MTNPTSTAQSPTGDTPTDGTEPVWGACGVENCRDCWPLFNEANEPVTDNFGRSL